MKEAEAEHRHCWVTSGWSGDLDATWEIHGTLKPEEAFDRKIAPKRSKSYFPRPAQMLPYMADYVKNLGLGDYLDYPGGPNIRRRPSERRAGRSESEKEMCWWKQGQEERAKDAPLLALKVEEGTVNLEKLEKAREWVLPGSLQKESSPADILILAQ